MGGCEQMLWRALHAFVRSVGVLRLTYLVRMDW
jgi:hypothetical protein